jgi:hypothetical protein
MAAAQQTGTATAEAKQPAAPEAPPEAKQPAPLAAEPPKAAPACACAPRARAWRCVYCKVHSCAMRWTSKPTHWSTGQACAECYESFKQ